MHPGVTRVPRGPETPPCSTQRKESLLGWSGDLGLEFREAALRSWVAGQGVSLNVSSEGHGGSLTDPSGPSTQSKRYARAEPQPLSPSPARRVSRRRTRSCHVEGGNFFSSCLLKEKNRNGYTGPVAKKRVTATPKWPFLSSSSGPHGMRSRKPPRCPSLVQGSQ